MKFNFQMMVRLVPKPKQKLYIIMAQRYILEHKSWGIYNGGKKRERHF